MVVEERHFSTTTVLAVVLGSLFVLLSALSSVTYQRRKIKKKSTI
jgi:hypothetical protein